MQRIARAVRALQQQKQQVAERKPLLPYVTLRSNDSLSVEWISSDEQSADDLSILQIYKPDTLDWHTVYRGLECKFCIANLRSGTLYKLRLRLHKGAWGEEITASTKDDEVSMQCLHRAIQYGYTQDVLKILKARRSASATVLADSGHTALQLAAMNGDRRILEIILQHASASAVNAAGEASRTPLMLACGIGNHEVVQLLSEHGASWQLADRNGLRALHYATSQDDIVQFAMEKDVNVDDEDYFGRTPLLRGVILNTSRRVLRTLINNHASVNHRDADGWSCMAAAIVGERKAVIRLLLEHEADINSPSDSQGNAALPIAVDLSDGDTVNTLSPVAPQISYFPSLQINVDSDEETN